MNSLSNSIQHLTYILNKLDKKEPFAIIRPADGEYAVMVGTHLTNCDNWTFNGGTLQDDLLHIKELKKGLTNFYIGIPCSACQGVDMYNSYNSILNITDNERTYANIFCNKNWKKFTDYLISKRLPLNYIGPGTNKPSEINIQNMYTISPYLVNSWDSEKQIFISNITEWVRNLVKEHPATFVFSAGPISKYIIPILYRQFPESQFLDVGSSLDVFMKGTTNRGYIRDNDYYSNIVCSFQNGHTIITENDSKQFEGGWSYTPNEMKDFLSCIKPKDSYKILEFGSGSSTKVLYDILERFCYEIEYDTYENDIKYKVTHKNVNTIIYDIHKIDEVVTFNKKYDIIIIDGPNGVARAKWYEKIRHNIKSDTIILIDDYNHYIEFENALNTNFNYRILSRSDVPFVPNGEHSWRIITDVTVKEQVSDITVILNLYKRPHVLLEQINAIQQQTVQPKQIIIWRNHVDGIEIPEAVTSDSNIIIINCNKNLGVWPRFTIGLLASTTYVAVFDDDTIPGKKWFENCVHTIKVHNSLLGSIGLIFKNSSNYNNFWRVGWDSCNDTARQVDIVGHAWFFKREWILELAKIIPDYEKLLIVGEDMGFSWALQQIGIPTYVPPHPSNDLEMFGSIPQLAIRYGTESVGISMNSTVWDKFDYMFNFYKNKGFRFINPT